MFDSPKELIEKIRLGEDALLELKEVRFAGSRISSPRRDSLADELAAFANSRGGVFVLGVDDKARKVIGIPIERLDAVEDFVREICVDSIAPPLAPHIERLLLPGLGGDELPVIRVEVARSLFVHQSPSGYLHRVGSARRGMPPDYLARLFQQRSQTRLIRFDEQFISNASLDDLLPDLWRRFASPRSRDVREDLLVKLALAREDETGIIRPTVAGVLFASRDPRRWLPNAFIQAVAYRGETVLPNPETAYQLDAADIAGPLDRQILDACHFVRKNMKVAAYKNMGRSDLPQFDLKAVFEAVVNAVAHRDYSVYGPKIRLKMFADRLEIYSPGTIVNTMTIESLPYRQAVRNEAIASLLARCSVGGGQEDFARHRKFFMDRRGEGVPIIMEESMKLSGLTPVYRLFDDAELLLTIFAANPPTLELCSKENKP
ncbi:MAG: transcriptional regulator [Syntrophobacteraceae bacterium CG2_30_61_12]|nr:MAG: transcriptional regulator [Syntrophobacteraceae bacterium CG2_30_61_12]